MFGKMRAVFHIPMDIQITGYRGYVLTKFYIFIRSLPEMHKMKTQQNLSPYLFVYPTANQHAVSSESNHQISFTSKFGICGCKRVV
jgi:hypothetical protein